MIFQTLSFKNLIALVCMIQCMLMPVSPIRCVHCIADEEGDCLMPFSKRSYEVDCTEHMTNREARMRGTHVGLELLKFLGKKPGELMEFKCMKAKGMIDGEIFIIKDCAFKEPTMTCEVPKLMAIGGFHIESCRTCSTDLCNSANNPYINITFFLPTVAIILYKQILLKLFI